MHIEPGIVDATKMVLSYATATATLGYAVKLAFDTVAREGLPTLAIRTAVATVLVFCFFEVLPHYPVGVSEVHFILGSTLFLLFGAGPASFGLALGLLTQGLFFAPSDLPQYGMNLTSLLVPLAVVDAMARRVIPAGTAYKDVSYRQALTLSTAYQGGVVAWVAFWALYGGGVTIENLTQVTTFGAAYMSVIVIEPLLDLGILAVTKSFHRLSETKFFQARLYQTAT